MELAPTDILVILFVIFIASGALLVLLRPNAIVNITPMSSSQVKKKGVVKKKRKSKETKVPKKKGDVAAVKDKESSSGEEEEPHTEILMRHRKSIELDLLPELLGVEKHEPLLNQNPTRPILKNRNSVENVDLNSSGIHYEHKIVPKDELEIVHSKNRQSMHELNYKSDPGFDENLESPWAGAFNDSSSDHESHGSKNKKPKNCKIEGSSQTEPLLDETVKQSQNAINDLNAKLTKLQRELKTSNDELANLKRKHSSLEENHVTLKNREEDVSTTCKVLQQELNLLLNKAKTADRELKNTQARANTLEQEKTMATKEIQSLRQSIQQLNGKLSVINNISNENLSLKNRLEQTEGELRNLMMCKNSFVDKEAKWMADLTESSARLQHYHRELEMERRRVEELRHEKSELLEMRSAQDRTLDGLKEQFAAMNQKQSQLTRDKSDAQAKYQASLNETRAQIATLTKQLHEAQAETLRLKSALDEEVSKTEQMVVVDIAEAPQQKLVDLEEQLASKEKLWVAREAHLKADAESLRKNVTELQKSLDASTASIRKAQEEKRTALTDIDKYKEALAAAEMALDSLQTVAEKEDFVQRLRMKQLEEECLRLRGLSTTNTSEIHQNGVETKLEQPEIKEKSKKKKKSKVHDDTVEEGEIRD